MAIIGTAPPNHSSQTEASTDYSRSVRSESTNTVDTAISSDLSGPTNQPRYHQAASERPAGGKYSIIISALLVAFFGGLLVYCFAASTNPDKVKNPFGPFSYIFATIGLIFSVPKLIVATYRFIGDFTEPEYRRVSMGGGGGGGVRGLNNASGRSPNLAKFKPLLHYDAGRDEEFGLDDMDSMGLAN